MAPNTSETRRRWACDRCHAQKLRCLRTINPQDGDCDRCIRVSATCGYSPPGRMGRPARSDSNSSTSSNKKSNHNRQSSITAPTSAPTRPSPPVSAASATTPETNVHLPLDDLNMLGEFHGNGSRDANLMAFLNDSTPFNTMLPGFGESGPYTPESLASSGAPFTAFPNGGQEMGLGATPDEYVRELLTLSLSQYEQNRLVELIRRDTGLDREALFNRLQGYPISEMLENAQKLTGLVDAFLHASRPRESTPGAYFNEFVGPLDFGGDVVFDMQTLPSSASSDDSALVDFSNSWDAADLTMQVPLPSPTIGSTIGSPGPGHGPSKARADTSTTLLVLSCYIRLARLYLLFLADLHCFLLASHLPDPAANGDRRLFPGLKLESFQQFMGPALEISLVVQVSEHMLSRLHKSLGLASSQDADSGQSSPWSAVDMITPDLMRAVQAQEGMDSQDDKGDTCTQLSLALDGVKRLLRARASL